MKKNIILSLLASSILVASEIELEQITVISATKTAQSIKDITSNINVITAEEIEQKHYTSVIEAINSIAGISYTSNGGLGSTTSILLRGASNNRTLVLIDGIRYQDPSSTSGANIGHLMIGNIQSIEIIKGAQSGIWGADASAGVINIITKKAENGTKISANIEYGSFNTKKFGASFSHKGEKFDIKLSANKITSDGFSVRAPKDEDIEQYEDDAYSNLTLNLKAGYNLTNDAKITLNVTDIDASKEYDSFGNPNDTTMQSDISNRLYNISYLQTYNNHNITLKAQRSEFSRDEVGTVAQWGSEYVKVFNGQHNNIELSDNIKYNEKDFIIFGLGSSSDDVDYIMTDDTKKQKENKDNYVYLTNSNTFDNIILTQSIRYDDYDNFDSKATGKLGIKYNVNKDIFLTSNVGLAYNVPNIVQELNPWGAVNDELNPENTKSSDITIAYKNFKVTYFYNEINDLIEWYDPDGWGGNPAIYKNLDGKSIFKGYEFEYTQNISDDVLFSLNYNLLSAKDKDDKYLSRRAKESLKLNIDYYPIDQLHLGLNGEYIGERYNSADKQGQQTGKYAVSNFVTNYEINKNFQVYGKIDNIFDKYYQVVDGFATAGRSVYVGLNVSY